VPDRLTQRLLVLMAILAMIIIHLGLNVGQLGEWWQIVEAAVQIAVFGTIGYYVRPENPLKSVVVVSMLIGAFLGHFALEQVIYSIRPRSGELLEGQFALALRSMMLAALPYCYDKRVTNLVSLSSLALVSIGVFLSVHWTVTAVSVFYAMVGVIWLVASYWDRLKGQFPEGTQSEIPRGASVGAIVVAAVLACLVVYLVGTDHATRALAGFMPSSGGSKTSDARSDGGVGDGEDLVRGTKDAMSFGPTESEVFLESQMPSIFDVFDDTYQGAVKKKSNMRKAVSLPPSMLEHRHSKVATTKSKGNDFSLLRQNGSRRQKSLDDRDAAALFFVKGRVPLHLRTHIYSAFDGTTLIAAEVQDKPTMLLTEDQSGHWFELSCPLPDSMIESAEQHLLKIINLKTERVPAPARLARFQIKDVDRRDMFAFTADGQPKMTVEFIPQMTVLRTESFLMAKQQLLSSNVKVKFEKSLIQLPDGHKDSFPKIRELAQKWAGNQPVGWEQVEAVCHGLQQHCQHDQNSSIETGDNPVELFLFENRRGPDYLFATSASLLLRELGYTTRIVSGFYADPTHYDAATWQTGVFSDDIHFWLEVSWDGKVWHPVEPTPGYELLWPKKTLWQHAVDFAYVMLTLCRQNWLVFVIALAFGLVAWALRRQVIDLFLQAAVAFSWFAEKRQRVLWTMRLIQIRACLLGVPRKAGQPVSAWLKSQTADSQDPLIHQFVSAIQWALYAGQNPCPVPDSALPKLCRTALRATAGASRITQISPQSIQELS